MTAAPGFTGPGRTVAGVDYSGARSDKHTWLTHGVLRRNVLELRSCERIKRLDLARFLLELPGDAVVALDFPFSVPQGFAAWLRPGAISMPDLWKETAGMDLTRFMNLRDRFVAANDEHFRIGDLYFPGCFSCLHKSNPNMVPMTFRGMQMLSGLWDGGCRVPPLPTGGQVGPLLLESMPGAALREFGLPSKGYKKGKNADALRRRILGGIQQASGIELSNLATFEAACLGNDDCLDSLVAAVTAALWSRDEDLFRRPQDGPPEHEELSQHRRSHAALPCENELAAARLEGWLYAPVFLQKAESGPGLLDPVAGAAAKG